MNLPSFSPLHCPYSFLFSSHFLYPFFTIHMDATTISTILLFCFAVVAIQYQLFCKLYSSEWARQSCLWWWTWDIMWEGLECKHRRVTKLSQNHQIIVHYSTFGIIDHTSYQGKNTIIIHLAPLDRNLRDLKMLAYKSKLCKHISFPFGSFTFAFNNFEWQYPWWWMGGVYLLQ